MDGLFHGKPYFLMDDLGGKPLFLETPIWYHGKRWEFHSFSLCNHHPINVPQLRHFAKNQPFSLSTESSPLLTCLYYTIIIYTPSIIHMSMCMVMVRLCLCVCESSPHGLCSLFSTLTEASNTSQAMRLCPLARAPLELNDAVPPHQKQNSPMGWGVRGWKCAILCATRLPYIDDSHWLAILPWTFHSA